MNPIAYYTDNPLSITALKPLGLEMKHIKDFTPQPSVFYGFLRGAGSAMKLLKHLGIDYWYVDNGYFDAQYVNENFVKRMDGKYRIVKNDTHDVFPGRPLEIKKDIQSVLILPPSQYSAHQHDTTAEDWVESIREHIPMSVMTAIRYKGDSTPLDAQINRYDAVVAFNSMAVLRACVLGKPAYDTHGCFRNFHLFLKPILYDLNELHDYYDKRQWTLNELKEGVTWS